jgi:hypothetical protein
MAKTLNMRLGGERLLKGIVNVGVCCCGVNSVHVIREF